MQKEGEVKWFDLESLEGLKIVPSDLLMLKEFIFKESSAKLHKIKMIEDGDNYHVEEFG